MACQAIGLIFWWTVGFSNTFVEKPINMYSSCSVVLIPNPSPETKWKEKTQLEEIGRSTFSSIIQDFRKL